MKEIIVAIISALIKTILPFAIEKATKAIRNRKRKNSHKSQKKSPTRKRIG